MNCSLEGNCTLYNSPTTVYKLLKSIKYVQNLVHYWSIIKQDFEVNVSKEHYCSVFVCSNVMQHKILCYIDEYACWYVLL